MPLLNPDVLVAFLRPCCTLYFDKLPHVPPHNKPYTRTVFMTFPLYVGVLSTPTQTKSASTHISATVVPCTDMFRQVNELRSCWKPMALHLSSLQEGCMLARSFVPRVVPFAPRLHSCISYTGKLQQQGSILIEDSHESTHEMCVQPSAQALLIIKTSRTV